MGKIVPIRQQTIVVEGESMETVASACIIDEFEAMKRHARLLMQPQYLEIMNDDNRDFVLRCASIKRNKVRTHIVMLCNARLSDMIGKYVFKKPTTIETVSELFGKILKAVNFGKHND